MTVAATPTASAVRHYVALGDSFSAGSPGADRDTCFPVALATLLRVRSPGLRATNLARAGVMSREVASAQLLPALRCEPDLVTVVCGANDVLLATRPDIAGHARALDLIVATLGALRPHTAVLVATTPDPSAALGLRPRSRRRVQDGLACVNDATREIARRHGVACADLARHPRAGEREHYRADGLHPTPAAARATARLLAAELRDHYGIQTGGTS